jgi:hypothetical protein
MSERSLPPVTPLAVGTLVLSVISAILIAANVPHHPPLAVAGVLLGVATLCLLTAIVLLARTHPFAWNTFFLVAGWSLAGYIVIAGMIEYAFIIDHTPSRTLAAMSIMLALFTIDVPLLLGFSVAQHQAIEPHSVSL